MHIVFFCVHVSPRRPCAEYRQRSCLTQPLGHLILPALVSNNQQNIDFKAKNPSYGRHRISQPMRIVGPMQFWRVCVIYLEEKRKKKWGG